MKNSIISKSKNLSKIFLIYLHIVLFCMLCITFIFKTFKIPGLSRILFLFSFLPTRDALRFIKFRDNGSISFPVFDYYYNMFFLNDRDYENEMLDVFSRINVPYVFFDGGANLGYISSSCIHLSKNCISVIAIEPNDKLKDVLELNILDSINSSSKRNFSYDIICKAISGETQSQRFFSIGRHAGSRLSSNFTSNNTGVYLDTVSLNDLVDKYGLNQVCFFKLDLEGAEFDALSTFKYFQQSIIMIEVLDFNNQVEYIRNLCLKMNLEAFMYIDSWISLNNDSNHKYTEKSISNVGLNLLLIPKLLKDKVSV
jgi:FkbM family methyltransferase